MLPTAATLPDARKGERIVLLTQKKGATRGDFASFAKSKGVSDLMVPPEVAVVETILLLGSGSTLPASSGSSRSCTKTRQRRLEGF